LNPFKLNLHARQWEVFQSKARFRVLVAGRRFGKTHLALAEMLRAASEGPNRVVWYVGPNDRQSKRIAWKKLKELTRKFWAKLPSETEMRIELLWGSTLVVNGAFHPDSLRGEGLDFLVIDESASIHPRAWIEVFRPALADRKGGVFFSGTPKGRNYFFDLFEHAKSGHPEWEAFQFTTAQGGLVDAGELESAARDLDPESYRQELEGDFTNTSPHRAYRTFDKTCNVKPVTFDNLRPLIWSIDFNINPMCMLLMQQVEEIVNVLEEIVIKPEAHTDAACEQFCRRAMTYYQQVPIWQRPLTVKIYGDASGIQRRTCGSHTDWEIIRQFFNNWRGTFDDKYFTATLNPGVRDRVNCVNSRLHNQAGETRLLIDPSCKELIRDLEEVSWEVDSTGAATNELSKSDKARTHASDALGYFISQAFPLRGKIGEKSAGPVLSF
jgi:Terminase large subunit, T4likevirus-type, N-terminal